MSSISRSKGVGIKRTIKGFKFSLKKPLSKPSLKVEEPTQQCIAASEKMYRDLVEMANEGITMVDPKDNLTFVNKQFAKSLGYKANELVGRSIFSISTKTSAAKMKSGTELRKKGLKSRYEVILIHKNGSQRCFWLSASPIYGPSHEFIGSMGVYADVTEKRAMELKLEKKVKQIDTLYRVYEHAKMGKPLGIVLGGIAQDVVQAFPYKEFVGAKFVFDGKVYCFLKILERYFHKIEIPLKIAGIKRGSLQVGYSKKIAALSKRDSLKEERELIRNVGDILRKHIQARAVLDRYREIIKKSFTSIIIVSDDKILYVNPRFYKMFKCKEKEVVGRNVRIFLPFYNPQIFMGGKVRESKARCMKGEEFDIALIKQFISYHGKQAVLIRVNDISLLKRAQSRLSGFNQELRKTVKEKTLHLEQANKRLQSLNQIKDEFIAITSHELRSPLTSIRGYLSFLVEEDAIAQISDPYRDYLMRAYSTTDALNYLINNILDVSRLDMGRFELQRQDTNIVKLVCNILDSLSFQMNERRLQFEFENKTENEEIVLPIDSIRMSQVLRNILDNSIKFTKRGKKVRVTIKYGEKDLVIVIADQGVGIPKAKSEQIFDKFMQVKNTQTKYKGGVGLGLFIAKRIVELHNGWIRASKNSDGGTTVCIHLPLEN